MHPWKLGGEVWAQYYDLATGGYVAKLEGHVTAVGKDGFTMRRARARHDGALIEQHRHDVIMWPSREAAEHAIAQHPSPGVPEAPRNMRGG